MLRKGGRSSLPRHICVRVRRQRCTVDRNRAAIKSYLSYCYLGRNSPQVGYEHARMVSKATTTGANILCLSLSLASPLYTLFVRTHCREIRAHRSTDRIYFNGRISAHARAPSLLSFFHVRNDATPQTTERKRERIIQNSFLETVPRFYLSPKIVKFSHSIPLGRFPCPRDRRQNGLGRSRYAAVTNYVNQNGREARYHAPFCILLCMTA